jgi:hypothetical protein
VSARTRGSEGRKGGNKRRKEGRELASEGEPSPCRRISASAPRLCGRSPFVRTRGRASKGGRGREGAGPRRPSTSARTRWVHADITRVHADSPISPRGNFITDTTMRPSHGQPSGHLSIVRPSVRPSVLNRPRDNPAFQALQIFHFIGFRFWPACVSMWVYNGLGAVF